LGFILKQTGLKLDSNLTIFVGNFGSGKTEVAVNFARYIALSGVKNLKIVDLDIVNPYFRTREAKEDLEKVGIEVIAPADEGFYAESPMISPKIKSQIQDGSSPMILDVGGDDLGARILSFLNDAFIGKEYELLMVLNVNRPFTGDAAGCMKIMSEIEGASRLKVTGLVSNAHLIDETTMEVIEKGYGLVKEVSKETGVPVKFITLDKKLENEVKRENFHCPVLLIERLMLKPWEHKVGIPRRLRGL
jgi:hypothetical protein